MSSSVEYGWIEVRITDEERRLAEAAASALDISLEEFVREAVRDRALDVLGQRQQAVLADDAARGFLAKLDADAPPPDAMRGLFRRETPWRT